MSELKIHLRRTPLMTGDGYNYGGEYVLCAGNSIAWVIGSDDSNMQAAQRIVDICNQHAELLAALEEAERLLRLADSPFYKCVAPGTVAVDIEGANDWNESRDAWLAAREAGREGGK